MRSLEERVLRVLYEGGASAFDCAMELQRYDGGATDLPARVERLLADLARRSYLEAHAGNGHVRYRLTEAGSALLAALAERSQ